MTALDSDVTAGDTLLLMNKRNESPLTFGIYPFGFAGTAQGLASGKPDDMRQIGKAVTDLSGGKLLLPRTYVAYGGPATASTVLGQVATYGQAGIKWDLVLRFQGSGGDRKPWTDLIREIVRRFGTRLADLQITNEANLQGVPGSADGSQPDVRRALVEGILAARDEIKASGATVKIGFSAVPSRDPTNDFWRSLPDLSRQISGKPDAFANAIDYVGFDIYPDVFGPPIKPQDLGAAVTFLLRQLREVSLPSARILASTPIHIAENGWPTGGGDGGRTEAKQAIALETIIRTIHLLRAAYNITQYELFSLRDADSSKDDLFHRFGIVRDDYSRKPAFDVYRKLIAELG